MIKNLTPHPVNILGENNEVLVSYPSVGTARITKTYETIRNDFGAPIVRIVFGEPVGLPIPKEDEYFIVSVTTFNCAKSCGYPTDHLLVPNDVVRDNGDIIGCRSLAIAN